VPPACAGRRTRLAGAGGDRTARRAVELTRWQARCRCGCL